MKTPSTSIPNHLLEQLSQYKLNGQDHRILFLIIQRTFGAGEDWSHISFTDFSRSTGLLPTVISRTIKSLLMLRVISMSKSAHSLPNKYKINLRYSEWQSMSKSAHTPLRNTSKKTIKSEPEKQPITPPSKAKRDDYSEVL